MPVSPSPRSRNVWGLSAFLMNNPGVGSFAGTAGIELGG
jgi:hypothetical protein